MGNIQAPSQFNASAAKISFFTTVSYAVDYSFQLVDIYWVSQLGPSAPTAITVVSTYLFLVLTLNEVVGVGTISHFSQSYGTGNKKRTGDLILSALVLKFCFGLAMSALFAITIPLMVRYYAVNDEVAEFVSRYSAIIWLSLILVPVYSTLMTALRTIGFAKHSATVSIIAVAVNALGNPVLIFGYGPIPALGITGAALATILAQIIAVTLCIYFLFVQARDSVTLEISGLRFQPGFYRSVVLIGLPVGGVILLYNLEQVLLTWIIVQYPIALSDGFSIGLRIFGLLYMINFGISVGVSVTVGHYVGRSDYASVERDLPRFSFYATGLVAFLSFIIFILAEPLARAFTDNVLSVNTAVTYLRFMMFANVGICLIYCFNGAFEGTGRTSITLVIAMAMYLVIEFPLLLASNLIFAGEFAWIWSVILLATMIGAFITIVAFYSGLWKAERLGDMR